MLKDAALAGLVALATLSAAVWADVPMAHYVRAGVPNVAGKLERGEAVTVAYIGGSITQANGYRPITTARLRERFPAATLTEVAAAVGGTGSIYGVFRFEREVLVHDPDLVFIEFAVNDNGVRPERVRRAMEAMVRKTWAHDPSTDVVFVYTVRDSYAEKLAAGELPTAMAAMEAVAEHYGVPSVLAGAEVIRQVEAGTMLMKPPTGDDAAAQAAGRAIFAGDGLHPFNETGHRLYAEAIDGLLGEALASPAASPHGMPDPLETGSLQGAKLVPLDDAELSGAWERLPADHPISAIVAGKIASVWATQGDDAGLTFRFRGTAVGASDFSGPASGHLMVSIDGEPPRLVERFDPYSHRYRRRFVLFADGLAPGEHELRITIAPAPLDKSAVLSAANFAKLTPQDAAARQWFVADLGVSE